MRYWILVVVSALLSVNCYFDFEKNDKSRSKNDSEWKLVYIGDCYVIKTKNNKFN